MIVGITGALCAGKQTLVKFLVQTYNFEAVNLLEIFKGRLQQLRAEKKKAIKKDEEGPEEENHDDLMDDDSFCFEYYLRKRHL